jgi:thiol-disulfide isomerase/thioredoxin
VGRLQALIAATLLSSASLFIGACGDEKPAGPTRSRSDAVLTSASPSSATTAPKAPPSASAAPAERKLCASKPASAGEPLPEEKLARIGPSSDALAETLQTGDGKWTWVNLWAGWCKPCKEEMPLLLEWQKKLSSRLRVAFVSIDDDLRLSEKFLDELKAPSYHLEAKERDAWLEGVGLGASTKLPSHILFDDKGKVRCLVKGMIEPRDYAELETLVKAAP